MGFFANAQKPFTPKKKKNLILATLESCESLKGF